MQVDYHLNINNSDLLVTCVKVHPVHFVSTRIQGLSTGSDQAFISLRQALHRRLNIRIRQPEIRMKCPAEENTKISDVIIADYSVMLCSQERWLARKDNRTYTG
jgi:hypothetical protein